MLVDDGTFGDGTVCMFDGTCTGNTGKYVAVGDTFDSISGFVDQRRGSHMTGAGAGGYYGLMPHSTGGLSGWGSDGWSATCQAKIDAMPTVGLSDAAVGGILAGIFGGILVGCCLMFIIVYALKGSGGGGGSPSATAKAVTIAKAETTSTTVDEPAGADKL